MTELKLLCEVCTDREPPIGVFDLEDLVYPIEGRIFRSPDPDHEVPPPFDPAADWQACKCRRCGFRAFTSDRQVLTNVGYVDVPDPDPDGKRPKVEATELISPEEKATADLRTVSICPECGKAFKTPQALKVHQTRMHK